MVGLIQKLLFDLIETVSDAETLETIKRRAEIPQDREYRINEVYDDAEWRRLFKATCEVLNLTQEQAEEAYAEFFGQDALKRWPMWFEMSGNSRDFLRRQPKIHNGFATGVSSAQDREAINDKFNLVEENGGLVMRYRSENQLCGLYKSLARWVIRHYDDQAEIAEPKCLKNGDDECEIHIHWA